MRGEIMRLQSTLALAAVAALCGSFAQAADSFPSKPIRILVGYPPGSGSDVLARIVGQKMAEGFGQSVVVENRPGAAGVLASGVLARAAPDGYSMVMVSIGHTFIGAYNTKLTYDTIKDFAGISLVADVPQVLVVSPALRIRTMRELIDLAKSKPGTLNYASAGVGSSAFINAELFNTAAGIKVVHVPFKGMAEAITGTIGGSVQYVFSSLTAAVSLIKSERIVALGISTKNRAAALPDVPSMAEAGLPGFDFSPWYALLAPARTPKPVKDRLAAEVARLLALPDVRDNLASQGATPRPSKPEELDALIKQDVARMDKLIRDAGIPRE
jgi:tripartite-type tricarboxylate transporter receptor subunit TctC